MQLGAAPQSMPGVKKSGDIIHQHCELSVSGSKFGFEQEEKKKRTMPMVVFLISSPLSFFWRVNGWV